MDNDKKFTKCRCAYYDKMKGYLILENCLKFQYVLKLN